MRTIKKKRVGFVGVGAMGKPMALNIMKADFPLTVYGIREESLAEMRELGAKVSERALDLGKGADVVVVMVRTYPQIKQVIFPPEGVLSGMRGGSTLVVMSSISPLEIKELEEVARESGVSVIDAPVSGGRKGAQDGTLTIIVGGDAKVVENQGDVLKAMGKNIYHVGEVGHGQALKMINQLLVAANIVSVAEALILARKLELDLSLLLEVISNSDGDSRVWRTRVPRILNNDLRAGGALNILVKDTRTIMNTGMALKSPLPVSSIASQLYQWAESRGLGELDDEAVFQILEEFAQIKVLRE